MSHFPIAVLVPKILLNNADGINKFIEMQLDPFDENFHTPDYLRECYCIGSDAKRAAQQRADELHGTIDSHRERFRTIATSLNEKDANTAWLAFIEPWLKAEADCLAADPRKNSPVEKCEYCGGAGIITSNYNPMSKWDWYVIGGRWDGDFMPGNVCELALFSEPKKSPYAIVTPDRIWNEKGRMGRWGMSFDEMSDEEWAAQVKSITEKHAEEFVGVIVDCHI